MTTRGKPCDVDGSRGVLPRLITPDEFAQIVGLSRRQVDRMRAARPDGFPREYELGSGRSRHGRCPRFKLEEVLAWMETRVLW